MDDALNEKMNRAAAVLQKEFGTDWRTVAQMLGTEDLRHRVGKDLTSFMAFPDRGTGGSNRWRGNCSPEVVRSVTRYVLDAKQYEHKDVSGFTLLDPMSGSGTSKDAADSLGVQSVLYDLNPNAPAGFGGWDALKHDVEHSADLIFLHPPYHNMIQYSGKVWGSEADPDDLSCCTSYGEYIDKLNFVIKKLFLALRSDGRLAILVGDLRSGGKFYSIQRDLMRLGDLESFIVKSQFNCVSDSRTYSKPFIPVVTEYLLLYHKLNALIFQISWQKEAQVDLTQSDSPALTWNHLIRTAMESMGGKAKLSDLGNALADHPKAQRNPHFRERIRAAVYEHRNEYVDHGGGWYSLSYAVA